MAAPNFTVHVSPASIHVGDVGTIYQGRIMNVEPPFDPLTADIRHLLFYFENGSMLTKAADAEADPSAGSPTAAWFLSYTVKGDDGLGSPAGIFHAAAGALRIQAYLEWTQQGSPSAEHLQWHSDVATVDIDGQELRIFPNLE